MSDCGKFKLTYFDARALGELIRVVLKTAGKEFEDVRIKREDWPALKPSIPTGMLPLLETPCGKKLSQSLPTARFLAGKMDLYSEDKWEQYLIERAIDVIRDISNELYKIMWSPEDKKDEMRKAFCEGKGKALFKVLETFLEEKEGGFFIGSKVTLADLALVCLMDSIKEKYSAFLEDFPKFKTHYDAVLQDKPTLADWIKTRPVTEH